MPEPGGTADDDDGAEGRRRQKPKLDPKLAWQRVRWLFVVSEFALGTVDHKATALAAVAARAVVVIGDAFFRP